MRVERALEKIARQLLAFDEASLTSLWEKYAAIVQDYEPTRKWEEAAVIFGLLQGVRWKNQLFNYHWKQSSSPGGPLEELTLLGSKPPFERPGKSENGVVDGADKRGKLLRFRPREDDESV